MRVRSREEDFSQYGRKNSVNSAQVSLLVASVSAGIASEGIEKGVCAYVYMQQIERYPEGMSDQ